MTKFNVKRYELIAMIVLFLLPITGYIVDSMDELLAICSILFLIYSFLYRKIRKDEKQIILMMLLIVVLGLLSNVFSRLISNYFVISIDILEFLKTVVVFIAFRIFFRNKDFSHLSGKLSFIAKIVIITAFTFAIISQFGDIGMTMRHADGNIYPEFGIIQPFGFYTRNGMQTYYLLSGCLIFILAAENNRRSRKIYVSLYFIVNVLTGATLVWAADILLVAFYVFYKRKKNLKIRTLIFIALSVTAVAFPAIKEYIFDSRAPRSVLIYYGFLTAYTYFPLGAGFASYGGEMAARYYSPLYWKYGFDDRYGLSHSGYGGILNDDYIAMIAAQFGFAGLFVFGCVYYKLYKLFDFKKVSLKVKPLMMSVFGTIVCSMMISANSKTLMGVWIYAILGMCSTMYTENKLVESK